jgi:DNA-binding transcriptional LysR family regulator
MGWLDKMWKYDDLSIVIEVIRQGSFIEASNRLNIPSSTVSRRVNELENSLGIRLIERTSRSICPTETGRLLFEQCSSHMQSLKERVAELTAKKNDLKGRLRITAPIFLGGEILSEWFSQFLVTHQQIDLDILLSNQYVDMFEENIDVAVRVGPLKSSRLIAQYLFTSRFILCASAGYLNRISTTISQPEDLQQHPVLLLSQHNNTLDFTDKQTAVQTQWTFRPKIRVNDISVIRQSAVNGLGVACLPEVSIRKQISSGALMTLLDNYQISKAREIYAVYPSRKYLSQKTLRFLEYIKIKASEIDKR